MTCNECACGVCQKHPVGSINFDPKPLSQEWAVLYNAHKSDAKKYMGMLMRIRDATRLDDDSHYILDKIEGILGEEFKCPTK